ncbi:hypothetical protein DFH07DRAFT_940383 [Mycena maculata]|uniref:Uncharacterized protein n=1 Tax=Mycena maculata TaxID=230809 RepID=A0AAD7J6T9_9AGAR|nr:hypothetical protein DFH07DRAFT_1068704 [Mycena maculata]KAJ7758211.1 hypothetical protein DFH07DRAFT_940383 [Mycena maculata]
MSTTPAANYLRAATPATTALLGGQDRLDPNNDAASSRLGRQTLLQGASTVEEVISMVPDDFRGVLREPLLGVASTATKLIGCRSTLQKWLQHQAAGTFPPHVRSKAPELQLTKEFGQQDAATESNSALTKLHTEYLAGTLTASIKAKSDEAAFLERALTPQALFDELKPLIEAKADSVLALSKLPNVVRDPASGELRVNGWIDNHVLRTIAMHVLEDCVVYAFRVISITEASALRTELKFHKKKALHQQADVEMADATKPGPSIQSLVDKAVSTQLKKLKSSGKGKGKTDGKKGKTSSKKPPFKASDKAKPYVPKPARKTKVSAIKGGKPAPQKGKGKAK